MKRLLAVALLFSALASSTPAWADSSGHSTERAAALSLFRLQVDGAVESSATFWVAYGPLDGQWGIRRLRAASARLYALRLRLPPGRTVISFIQGTGVLRTPHGDVPGAPVTTIRQIGPIAIGARVLPIYVWHEPMG